MQAMDLTSSANLSDVSIGLSNADMTCVRMVPAELTVRETFEFAARSQGVGYKAGKLLCPCFFPWLPKHCYCSCSHVNMHIATMKAI